MRALLLTLSIVLAQLALAQFPYTRVLEVRPGQQRPAIGQLVQDSFGLIWVGSDLGLLRTDGEHVDVMLRTENSGVQAMCASGRGVIAALTTGVLVRCDALGCDTLWKDTLLRTDPVRALVEDNAGRIWIGTYGKGVLVLENGRSTAISDLPDAHVNDLCVTADGHVAVATDQGLAFCSTSGVLEVFGETQGAPDNLVLAITATPDGSVWAGTDRSGAFRWKPGKGRESLEILDPKWASGPIRSIQVVGDLVWLGTQDHGVIMVDRGPSRGSYASQRPVEGRPSAIDDLLLDHEGAVWWCDGTELLHRADPAILFVPEHEGLDLRVITALCSDAHDRIWFATPKGLFNHVAAFAEELKVTRSSLEVDPTTKIVSLAAADDGTVWAATFGSGVYALFANGKVAHYTTADGLGNNNVLSVRARGDAVWFATLEGITRYRDGIFTALSRESGFVIDVLPHENGVLIATDGHGVMRWGGAGGGAKGKGTFYSLVHDANGKAWAAGPGTGFCRFEEDSARCLAVGLPPFDGELFSLGNSNGHLLAFGSTGVSSVDPTSGMWTDLTARFGLEGMKAQLNALCNDRGGALWLACNKGLVRMQPTAAHFDPRIPAVIIGALVDNASYRVDQALRTSHDRNDITIQFTGLHYADPGAVRFEYRLRGLDDRVIRTRDREVSFSALPPGDYRFEIRAFTGEAPVSDDWAALDITVDAPWWRWPWVVALGAVLVFVTVFWLLRGHDRRLRYRERMEQEQVRFQLEVLRSQVDPHFLFNSFNALVELIESEPAKAVEHVEQLSVFFRNILLVRDKERITLEEELDLVANYFALEQRRFGEAITIEVHVGGKERSRGIMPLTLQLLVENAMKHNVIGKGQPFLISITAGHDTVIVQNPLRPRLSPPRSTGFGLESIVKRYKALTTRPILVEKTSDTFSVRIPLIDP
ncbi:MAG: two-component regulator propeller domain-containing protein [Flavobacteriales bacterium]